MPTDVRIDWQAWSLLIQQSLLERVFCYFQIESHNLSLLDSIEFQLTNAYVNSLGSYTKSGIEVFSLRRKLCSFRPFRNMPQSSVRLSLMELLNEFLDKRTSLSLFGFSGHYTMMFMSAISSLNMTHRLMERLATWPSGCGANITTHSIYRSDKLVSKQLAKSKGDREDINFAVSSFLHTLRQTGNVYWVGSHSGCGFCSEYALVYTSNSYHRFYSGHRQRASYYYAFGSIIRRSNATGGPFPSPTPSLSVPFYCYSSSAQE